MLYLFLYESAKQSCAGLIQAFLQMGQFYNGVFSNNATIRCANFESSLSRFRANTTFHNFFTTFAPNQTAQEDTLWNPKS